MGCVLDIFSQNVETIDLGGQARGDRRDRPVAAFSHFTRSACRVGGGHRFDIVSLEELAALAEPHDVGTGPGDLVQFNARQAHQLEPNRQIVLANDLKACGRQQIMNVTDPAGDRVLDRNHGEFGLALLDSREAILKCAARKRRQARIGLVAGNMGVCPGFTLIRDVIGHSASFFAGPTCVGSPRRKQKRPFLAAFMLSVLR